MPSAPRAVLVLFIIAAFFHSACQHTPRQVTRAVYYWKNDTYIGFPERKLLKRHEIGKVYVKLLDVDWDEVRGAYPVSINPTEYHQRNMYPSDSLTLDWVPVIFITNKVFERIDSSGIRALALRVLRKCYTAFDGVDAASEKEYLYLYGDKIALDPREIQFDCDWTAGTSKKYFYFLSYVKKLLHDKNTRLSATIRLHQFKYPGKTGVPPVEKGMLMMYNITDLTKHTDINSIFDYDKAKPYFSTGKKYPLPLDLALPAYSWGIVYRNKQFLIIENGMTDLDLQYPEYFRPAGNHFFNVIKDTVVNNVLLRPGDEIKIEGIDEKRLMQAAELSRKALNNDHPTISFFDLSSSPIKDYSHETIEQVYNSFR